MSIFSFIGGLIAGLIYVIYTINFSKKEKLYFIAIAIFLLLFLSVVSRLFLVSKEWWFTLFGFPLVAIFSSYITVSFGISFKFWRKANKNTEKALEFFKNEKDWHLSYNKVQLISILGKKPYVFYTNNPFLPNKVYVVFTGSLNDEKVSMKKFLYENK